MSDIKVLPAIIGKADIQNPENGFTGKDRVPRIVAELLESTMSDRRRSHHISQAEAEALQWLSEQWDADPEISFSAWVGDRVREWRDGKPVRCGCAQWRFR